jgi:hypothetical protein
MGDFMAFTGKATYTAGTTLPEMAEDVSDLVGVVSPHETPLLYALGYPARPARATVHEWLEDTLLPNTDTINDSTYTDAAADTQFVVTNGSRFRPGDQIQVDASAEVMLVTAVATNTLTVVRGYGATTPANLANGLVLHILGNAALEGDAADAARFTARTRKTNYTQIFSSTVEVSGSELAVRQLAVADELDYQKQQRLRELLRDLENCVINGRSAAVNPEGSASVRRTMKGAIGFISTNRFIPGTGSFPSDAGLTEEQLNFALRSIWENSNGHVDLIVVNGQEKRWINEFVGTNRRFTPEAQKFTSLISQYESDFGVCQVVMSRWVPSGSVLLLDSSRIEVMPLSGRSFQYKPLGVTGDRQSGQVIGEYTLEMRNENAHGLISGLSA